MCTLEKRGHIYILTLTGTSEHRLNPSLISTIRSTLTQLETPPHHPTALITTAHGKYFSNGYDLSWALSSPQTRPKTMSKSLRLLISDLISLPMPTIAAVTGHASAAGLALALSHDYIIMRKDKGFLYMSELDIGHKMPNWFMEILKVKIGDPRVWRNVVMRAEKVTAVKGLEWGILDGVGEGVEETVEKAVGVGEELVTRGWDGRIYAENRMTVVKGVLDALGTDETVGDFGDDDRDDKKVVSRL